MATHTINIVTANQQTGIPQSSDGVVGLICKGVAVSSTFLLNQFYKLTSMDDLTALGITSDYDVSNNTAIYQHISEFYEQAGTGSVIWLAAISKATDASTFFASATFKTMMKSTGIADYTQKIKLVGFGFNVPISTQSSNDFPIEVLSTVTALHNALISLQSEYFYSCGVVDGYNMSTTITPSTIGTLATQTNYLCQLLITGTQNNGVSSIGQYLGKISQISVGTSPGRVADGALNSLSTTMYLTNKTAISSLSESNFDSLAGKQYLFARTLQDRVGYYYNDGSTCEAADLALSTIQINRIANKLMSGLYVQLTGEREKSLPVNTAGNLDAGYCATLGDQFYQTYILPLITSGDISNAKVVITGINYTTTRTFTYKLSILPNYTYNDVDATITFVNTL